MAGSTSLIARKSIRARLGRTIAIVFAVLAGVSFVSGSFVLADSLTRSFDQLIEELVQDVDLQVRTEAAFENDDLGNDGTRPPISVDLADTIAAVDGVAIVEPDITGRAQLIGNDGEPIATAGGPVLGVVWTGEEGLTGVVLKEGRAPNGPGDVALDKATADRENFDVGDDVAYVTDNGRFTAELVGTVGLSDSDSFLGASVVVLDVDTGLDRYGANGLVDVINVGLAEGADVGSVTEALEAALPDNLEVVSREVLIEEAQDQVGQFISIFGTGLLIFAFITAFVSAFIINNVFQITIGQRLRELALLRAIGASAKQVKRLISVEALIVGIVGTVLGIFGGVVVAQLIVMAFNAAGAGFPSPSPVILPRTIIVAAVVGIGVTMLSVIIPARRAAKIPPVAAMRPEIGFASMRQRRLAIGAAVTTIGAAMFLVGLFVRPGGTPGLIAFAGGGGLALFLGVASLSATFAAPVTRFIGWPVAKLFKTPGRLARDNVARAPRRTSSSAAALMIGVALVSAAAVFASSLRTSITATFDRVLSADYIVQSEGGGGPGNGFPPIVVETLAGLPEISAATPFRVAFAEVEGDVKTLAAVDPVAAAQLVDFDVVEGDLESLPTNALAVFEDSAEGAGLEVGDTTSVTFESGEVRDLEVAVVFADNSFGLNWFVGLDLLDDVTDGTQSDIFALAKLADGVDPAVGDAAVREAMEAFTQVTFQSNAEFLQEQEDQINQLLTLITLLLAFAIVIAIIGISITLALGVFERTHEIGLLRAIGMNRRQTRRSVRWEAVIVSVFGAVIGIVLGTFLGTVLSLAVPENIISELAFNPTIVAYILVGAVIAGFVAAIYPSSKASNMNVLQAIATE